MDFSRLTGFENHTDTCTRVMTDEMMMYGSDGEESAYRDAIFIDRPIG